MERIDKKIRFNKLLQIYGNLLSSAQREILNDYYCYDLSISEIAESRSSSRAAVEDAIKKGNKKLESYEEELNVLEVNTSITNLVEELKNTANPEQLELLKEIERRLK